MWTLCPKAGKGTGPVQAAQPSCAPHSCPPRPWSTVSKLAKWTQTSVFMIGKQRQILTPRLVNNVECELTGAIFHLHRQ